ncbi:MULTISPECIES: methyltransferase [unclassified Moorena]|uniref:methyltransferase n=1 Tax=unclassified Moorena TaxID=2683338 RepID=UPI001400D5F7|nr:MULTISPECIES: methyltransferase [unclassified Moorena]NEO16457.1 methyltransferase [Moorena sp. SIO3E8]NEQ00461.1 methyltransferase [Moorena sp. SIO3F7]
MEAINKQLGPDKLLELGLAFSASKTFLSAVELGVFTELAQSSMTAAELTEKLGLHPRSARDFLDALVALNVLDRSNHRYSNTPESDLFLDRSKPSYIGGCLEMCNSRLYGFWGSLTEGLQSGQPQNEAKNGEDFFGTLYRDPARLKLFLEAMSGVSMGVAKAIADKFPWEKFQTFIDIGTAQGQLPVTVALSHDHLRGGGFDLPVVRPIYEEYVASRGLSQRLNFHGGDFFQDMLPSADVLVMGHILHDWNLEEKHLLIAKAYEALPTGGALIVYDALIDDERCQNKFGLLMSLNMLIETFGGFDYTGADCCAWMDKVGFKDTYTKPLVGAYSMAVGIK